MTVTIMVLFFLLQENKDDILKDVPSSLPDNFPVDSHPRQEPNVEKVEKVEKEDFKTTLSKISAADKVVLTNVDERWSLNKNIIDRKTNEKITNVLKKIIEAIGYFAKNTYYVKTIENMYLMKDIKGNYRSIVNFFIFDVKNYHTVKLIIDFVSYDEIIYINFIEVDESGIKNVIQRYDFKYKSQGILNNHDMFDENIQILLDTYYQDKFKVIPLKNHYIRDLSGTFTFDQLTNRLLPSTVPIDVRSPFFCNKDSFDWDTKSIPIPTGEDCIFDNPTIKHYPNEPRNMPGGVTNSVDINEYSWLKDPARGHTLQI